VPHTQKNKQTIDRNESRTGPVSHKRHERLSTDN
jgi:hypothetical protein